MSGQADKADRELQKARNASDAAMRAALRGKGNAVMLTRRVAMALAAERVAWERVKGNGSEVIGNKGAA